MRARSTNTRWYWPALLVVLLSVAASAQRRPDAIAVPGHPPAEACTAPSCPLPKDTVPAAPGETKETPPENLPKTVTEAGREIESAIMIQPPCTPEEPQCALTQRQKFMLFVHRTYSPYTFVNAAFDSAYSHLTHESYGHGVEAFGKRYGATLADGEARSLMQTAVLSSVFHQDPRYHRLGRGNFFYRSAYASSRVFMGRTDDGRSAFNWPEMIGSLAASTLSNAYYPQRDRGVDHTLNRFVGGLGSDAGTEMLREFWPDMKKWFHRHEPPRIKKIEDKMSALTWPKASRWREADRQTRITPEP